MVFVPLEGNLTPEEQHAKMLERLNEMESGPKQQKPGEGRKTNNAKAFSNSRHPDKIHARHLQRRHHCERVIQARKDALDLAKKIEDKYRSPMNRYGFLHEMCSTQGIDDPQTVKELAHVNLRLHEETKDITDRYKAANLAKERIKNAGKSIIKKAHAKGNALLGVMGAAMKKKAEEGGESVYVDDKPTEPKEKEWKDMTSRERAMKFYNRTQMLAGKNDASPAVRKMKENRKKDTETAKASMKRSGDDVRLAGLKNKKRPDLKERQVLERLEAKYLGLVFVAEVKRKEKEKADKLQKMQERAKAIEAQDRENRLEAKLKRQKRLRDMAAYAGWGRQPHRMEGSKAPRSVLASKGLQILAAPAMRKRSIRLPSFKRTASKPVMEQVVEDVEATPKRNVRDFMSKALVKRDTTVVSPEEDEMSVVTLDSAAATIGSTARGNPFSPSSRRPALSPLEARSLELDDMLEPEGAEESKAEG
mmetsp:Transcript_11684/g.34461  ORF Transcript_11684/g.34461 Transcript_11684/m.34461 type:complete len:477 (+) Transcript_11684:210-1640(+)